MLPYLYIQYLKVGIIMEIKNIKLIKFSTREVVNNIFRINNISLQLLDEVYLGTEYKHSWICNKCGNKFIRIFKCIKRDNSIVCNDCRKNTKINFDFLNNISLVKYSSNVVINKILNNRFSLKDDVYLGATYRHVWLCECGEEFIRTFNSIKTQKLALCKKCVRGVKEKYDDISEVYLEKRMTKEEVNKLTGRWILLEDEIYMGNTYKHNWICKKCGKVFQRVWYAVKNQNQINCLYCKNQQSILMHKSMVDSIEGYEYINSYFKGDRLPSNKISKKLTLEIKHKYCDNVIFIRSTSFINDNQRCGKCCQKYENSFAYHIEVELGEPLDKYWDFEKNTVNPYHIWKSGTEYVCIKCTETEYHESYEIKCNNFYTGYRCPVCSSSKGEKRVKAWLDVNNIDYVPQKEFEKLIGLGGGNLSYDFYMPDYNLLIEYQGQYHDGTVSNQTKKQYEKQQEHDRRKREYAKENGIELLEIWYWDFDNIEEILNGKLKI